jgi:regulator of protease activity HflC (stomatin/prohibitin superfamily)
MSQFPLRLVTMIGGGIVALVIVFSGFYTIDQGEIGVVLRNGAIVGTADPGLHLKLPVVDAVHEISVRTESQRYENVQAYSKDIQAASLNIVVNFHVPAAEAARIYAEYGSIDAAVSRVLTPMVMNDIKIVFGRYNAATAISDRGSMVVEMDTAIREGLQGSGLELESLQLENIDFSDAFEQSVEQRMLAEVEVARRQQQLAQEKVQADILRTQATADADQVRLAAAGKADATRSQAEADAAAIRLRGEAEAASIAARGAAILANPLLIDLTKAERWDGALPSTMIPGSTVPFIEVQ